MRPSNELVNEIERITGRSAAELRRTPITDFRRTVERRRKARLRFTSHFPFIGRGCVFHGELLTPDEVEGVVDEALRKD